MGSGDGLQRKAWDSEEEKSYESAGLGWAFLAWAGQMETREEEGDVPNREDAHGDRQWALDSLVSFLSWVPCILRP